MRTRETLPEISLILVCSVSLLQDPIAGLGLAATGGAGFAAHEADGGAAVKEGMLASPVVGQWVSRHGAY